jgi:hypothetical protein
MVYEQKLIPVPVDRSLKLKEFFRKRKRANRSSRRYAVVKYVDVLILRSFADRADGN